MGCSDEIFDFLLKQHSEKEVEPFILCIAVYADPHFANIETFESWWNIENLALGGKKPKALAQTKSGIEQVLQYLVQLE
ncbi:MbcA/ParS/Xre antitoxin family protein [Psychromonas ingrahamii]|uniref:MbcA/ParS/Xre antitoxin family protein n=1 Tax=Psychromonas ingrahamii TaxID=357794 RepID=UPI0003019C31|nr:MbcA/ParS/Xre antitoxin family protein [Psychromonas ingrahamii]